MFRNNSCAKLLIAITLSSLMGTSCNSDKDTSQSALQSQNTGNPKIDKLKMPESFQVQHLYSPSENEHGSWVAMTFDNKGRMIASDQYGYLYRLQLPPVGDSSKPTV